MGLTAGQIPKVANVINNTVAVLTGTTIGTLGSNTNGVVGYTPGAFGGRVISILGTSSDAVSRDVFVYIFRDSTAFPIGLVNVPASSGNTNAARFPVDFLNGTNLPGLPIDSAGRQYIPLKANETLRFTTTANLTSARSIWLNISGVDFAD